MRWCLCELTNYWCLIICRGCDTNTVLKPDILQGRYASWWYDYTNEFTISFCCTIKKSLKLLTSQILTRLFVEQINQGNTKYIVKTPCPFVRGIHQSGDRRIPLTKRPVIKKALPRRDVYYSFQLVTKWMNWPMRWAWSWTWTATTRLRRVVRSRVRRRDAASWCSWKIRTDQHPNACKIRRLLVNVLVSK